jgi:hypothetical protein
MNLLEVWLDSFGQGIGQSQGLCLYRTGQKIKRRSCVCALGGVGICDFNVPVFQDRLPVLWYISISWVVLKSFNSCLTVVCERVSVISDYGLVDRGSIPDFSTKLCAHLLCFCTVGTGSPFPGVKARPGRDTDPFILPSVRTCRAVPPLLRSAVYGV